MADVSASGDAPDRVDFHGFASSAGMVVQAGRDATITVQRSAVRAVPCQLPAQPGQFAGRVAELAALDRALADAPSQGRGAQKPLSTDPAAGATVMISAIGRSGGIGKTWLALAWAHRN